MYYSKIIWHLLYANVLRYPYEYSRLRQLRHYLQSLGKKNAVFIWIPKTAGTSVFHILNKYGCPKLSDLRSVKNSFPQRGIVTFGHISYLDLLKKDYVSEKFDELAFKFCFSRDPYDRAVSLFFYLKRSRIIPDLSFLSFCRHLKDKGIDEIGLYNRCGLSQCNPQVRWIENINIDFIGKVESINDDIEKLLDILELPIAQLPCLNATSHKVYSTYYCEESQKIIEELYEEDFYCFGYKFREL